MTRRESNERQWRVRNAIQDEARRQNLRAGDLIKFYWTPWGCGMYKEPRCSHAVLSTRFEMTDQWLFLPVAACSAPTPRGEGSTKLCCNVASELK